MNSISGLCLTKLDVLDGLQTIRVCVDYTGPDGAQSSPRFASEHYSEVEPVYEEMSGWSGSTVGAECLEDLPAEARAYIARIEEAVGASIDIISTGPDRAETIILKDPFGG